MHFRFRFPSFLFIHKPGMVGSSGSCCNPLGLSVPALQRGEAQDRKTQTRTSCLTAIKTAPVVSTNSEGCPMPKKLRTDDDNLMEIFQQHYAELRREHSEYEDTVHKLECEVAGLQGRVDQLEELNKRLTEERDQFLERYSAMPTVSLRMASPRLPQHWAASTGPPPSKARRSRSNKSKCFPIAVSGGFLLAEKAASETASNKPNRFIS
jgi:hypothetical protein